MGEPPIVEKLRDHTCSEMRLGPNPFYECKSCNLRDEAADTIAALYEALGHAVAIIEAHVDRDALGLGGDPRDGQWPLLDEYLSHMNAALSLALGEKQGG